MKKFWLLLILFFSLSQTQIEADLAPPPGSRQVVRCVEFASWSEKFPELTLLAYITGPMIENYEAYLIAPDTCLHQGYKFNTLSIYGSTKIASQDVDLNNLNLNTWQLLMSDVNLKGPIVEVNDSLKKENIIYTITSLEPEITWQETNLSARAIDDDSLELDDENFTIVENETPLLPETESEPAIPLVVEKKPLTWKQKLICFFYQIFGVTCSYAL